MNINFRKLFVVLVGLICFVASARAESCDWVNDMPSDPSKYKYFTGIGFSKNGRDEAIKNAEDDVTKQVCDIIGSIKSREAESFETEHLSESTSSTAQRSSCLGVYTKNFERDKAPRAESTGDGEYIACVRYKYPIADLMAEQERLEKAGILTSGVWTKQKHGGEKNCKNGSFPVKIITEPENAFATIDDKGELSGYTGLEFGSVCSGSRHLKITLDNYETVDEILNVNGGKEIYRQLKRKTKRVEITTNLKNSKIIIKNGANYTLPGTSVEPRVYDFLMGEKYFICAENDEAKSVCKEEYFTEYSSSNYPLILSKLPGTVDFYAFKQRNAGVTIKVDGKEVKGNKTWDLSVDTDHKVVFEKDGTKIERKLTVFPNTETAYDSSELDFNSAKNSYVDSVNKISKGNLELSPLWLGIEYNHGNFKNDYGLSVPVKEFGLSGSLFLSSQLSFDFGSAYGELGLKNEKDHDYENYIKNTSAASLFANHDPLVLNFDINQSFLHYYLGGTWYAIGPSSSVAIFVGGGYDWYKTLNYEQNYFYSNFIDDETFKKFSSVEGKGAYVSAGIEFVCFRFTYKYGQVYNGISLEFILPI